MSNFKYYAPTAQVRNGKMVTATNQNKQKTTLFICGDSNQLWLTEDQMIELATKPFAKFQTVEVIKGETFTANRDSRRTKLQGWQQRNAGKDIKECPLKPEQQKEPLYFEGEEVERTPGIYTLFINLITKEEYLNDKMLATA